MLSYSSAGSGGAGGLDSPLEFFEPPCMKIVPTPLLLYGNAFWGGLGVILAGGPAHCRYATDSNSDDSEENYVLDDVISSTDSDASDFSSDSRDTQNENDENQDDGSNQPLRKK